MLFLHYKIGYTLLSFQLWELCHVSFFRFQFVISGVSNSISMCADIKIHVSFFYIKVYRIAWSLILTWTTLLPSIIKLTDLLAVKNYPCIHNFLDPEKQISIFSSKLKNNHIHNKTSTRDTGPTPRAFLVRFGNRMTCVPAGKWIDGGGAIRRRAREKRVGPRLELICKK